MGTQSLEAGSTPRVRCTSLLAGATRAPAMKSPTINPSIHGEQQRSQHPLALYREPRWIDDRDDIVLDEAALVHYAASLCTKPVFQGRKRADPSHELNEGRPSEHGDVKPWCPMPAQGQKATSNSEQNKAEVEDENEIGEDASHERVLKMDRS